MEQIIRIHYKTLKWLELLTDSYLRSKVEDVTVHPQVIDRWRYRSTHPCATNEL